MKYLSPNINTDVKMPSKVMHALNRHEAICVTSRVYKVTPEEVRSWLTDNYGSEFASLFKDEYLFNFRGSEESPR